MALTDDAPLVMRNSRLAIWVISIEIALLSQSVCSTVFD